MEPVNRDVSSVTLTDSYLETVDDIDVDEDG